MPGPRWLYLSLGRKLGILAETQSSAETGQCCTPAAFTQVVEKLDCLDTNWASDRCQDQAKVREAPTIVIGIKLKAVADGCPALAWGDDCPSSSSSSSSSESSEPSSSSSSSQSYRYTYTLATSCDSGSGTDGAVQVKVTDSK